MFAEPESELLFVSGTVVLEFGKQAIFVLDFFKS